MQIAERFKGAKNFSGDNVPTGCFATSSSGRRVSCAARRRASPLGGFLALALLAGASATTRSAPAASPYPADELTPLYVRAAEHILAQTGMVNKGYCLVFGAGEGRLAYELALRSRLDVIGVEQNPEKVDSGRSALLEAGLYGDRITLHQGSLEELRYRDYAAVLVVSDSIVSTGAYGGSAAELFRMVRPDGGVALIGQPAGCPNPLARADLEGWLGGAGLSFGITEDDNGLWARVDRAPLAGAGEWTKMWADLGNTACSRDERTTDDWRVLWFGQPGPRVLVERHARAMGSLYKAGKWVIPGAHRVTCVDAYNGARLWDLEVPDSSRVAVNRDAGWVALTDDYVYIVAQEDCLKADVETGTVVAAFHPPTESRDWGYVAVDGNLLLGSEQVPDASVVGGVGGNHWDISHGDGKPVVASTGLFCRNADNGDLLWTYDAGSVIANPTICVSDDAVFFFESFDPMVVGDKDGRVDLPRFAWATLEHLVKLDKETGELQWREQRSITFQHSIYLSCANGVLLASGARTGGSSGTYVYDFFAYAAADCAALWARSGIDSRTANNAHGYQDKHPMIVGNTVYFKYGSLDLQTGAFVGFSFGTSNCSDCSASMNHCFSRNEGNASIYRLGGNGLSDPLSPVIRPGCYIDIIPAGGLIMLPAASSGCTCDYPIQTSIAWQPQ
ncbi:MAG TPA: PQQ-binding-like beta-propeller repeat protein [Sumerlaeia bacterium]|nr:PQQ-binding-like beta-propeller repeat protein [Sumerlaeia bacterium]